MVFSSLFFVFFFLALCYGCYFFARTVKARNIILLVSSLIFYAWGGPVLLLLLALMVFVCWVGAIIIENCYHKPMRLALCWTITAICLAILVIFKYTGFLFSTVIDIFGLGMTAPSIALPIGISFYTFQLISYVIDVYRGEVEAQKKYHLLLLYASLFHQCIAGPIVRYADVNYDIEHRVVKREEVSAGITRFAVGLAKKAILANGCGAICDGIFNDASGLLLSSEAISGLSSGALILGCLCYTLQIYLDFSAYSDMAIGMGLMVGFHYKENFNYPYIADSITDFWRRWHMSLSTFFRDYVYIPLGGNRVGVPRQILNMLVVWALTGFWHGANWNFVLWGLFFFVCLVIEKYLIKPEKDPKIYWRIPRIFITFIIINFSFIIFKFTDMSSLWSVISGIFTSNGKGFSDPMTASVFKNNLFFIIASLLACLPIIPVLNKLLDKNKYSAAVRDCIGAIIPIVLIVFSAFALAGDSYNPFLYFQF